MSVYLDNAATTMMPPEAIRALTAWVNRGNPSAAYASAQEARQLIDGFRQELARYCGVKLANGSGDAAGYELLFTSGGSESNCTIVRAVVDSFERATRLRPHVISSAIEHKSLLACLKDLEAGGVIQLTLVEPDLAGPSCGCIAPDRVAAAVRPNTALVSIMSANNETGAINDLRGIAAAVRRAAATQHARTMLQLEAGQRAGRRRRRQNAPTAPTTPRMVPIHTDAVQLFGKSTFAPMELGVDAFSVSFHKLGGPPGIGLLGIRRELVDGYRLCPLVCGTQNGGLRGGTEAVHQVAAACAGFRSTLAERGPKNRRLVALKNLLRNELGGRVRARWLAPPDLLGPGDKPVSAAPAGPEIVWIAPPGRIGDIRTLPGTLLLCAVPPPGRQFCNLRAREALEKQGFIVGIGSACNTGSGEMSHVLRSLRIRPELARGTIRVSLGSDITEANIRRFADALAALTKNGV